LEYTEKIHILEDTFKIWERKKRDPSALRKYDYRIKRCGL
jgi:hypothetical protein